MIERSDIKFIGGNGGGRSNAFAQLVARQHFQIVAGAEDDDRAGFTGGIDSSVRRDRRGDVLAEHSKPLPIHDYLTCSRFVARHHAAVADDIEPSLIEERRRHFRNSPVGGPRHVTLGAVSFTARAHRDDHVRDFFHKGQHAFPLTLRESFVLVQIPACYYFAYWHKVSRSLFRHILAQLDTHVCREFILSYLPIFVLVVLKQRIPGRKLKPVARRAGDCLAGGKNQPLAAHSHRNRRKREAAYPPAFGSIFRRIGYKAAIPDDEQFILVLVAPNGRGRPAFPLGWPGGLPNRSAALAVHRQQFRFAVVAITLHNDFIFINDG